VAEVESRMRRSRLTLSITALFACGDADGGRENSGDGSISMTSLTGGSATDITESGEASGSGSADASDTAPNPSSPTTADGTDPSDDGPTVFDLGVPDGGTACGGGKGGGGDALLSYIWIANSSQGSMSKINTETMIEEGRYIVRADSAGSPSRTSVNLNGDVAIANRSGGVTKVYANPASCQESNGMPGIQTSTGGNDLLAWGTEECVAWHNPMACSSNRPMAWTKGEFSEATCRWENAKLWTECWSGAQAQVMLLNGDTGATEQTVPIPGVNTLVYGGAVDGDGNFWGNQSGSQLIRVDIDDFSVQTWPVPPQGPSYGIAVDLEGRPWLCGGGGAARFDEATGTYQTAPGSGLSAIGGCMVDSDGILWHSRYSEGVLVGIDTETVSIVQELAIPAYVHGVSIDFQGRVWGVAFGGSQAYRVDPATAVVDTFNGLQGAYTYSDMTGFALSSAGAPSG
jgi:hypothetical protein